MPIFTIHQMNHPTYSDKQALELFQSCPSMWPESAKIQANDLEHAFALSKHTDVYWDIQPYVIELGYMPDGAQYGLRSTSVGDVIVDPEGHAWVVSRVGFKTLASTRVEA